MPQTTAHVRPRAGAPTARFTAPRVLTTVVVLSAVFALARGLIAPPPGSGQARPAVLPGVTAPGGETVPAPAAVDPVVTAEPPPPGMPEVLPIGIVAGHLGYDSGAVCPDGLREVDINVDVAQRVVSLLVGHGYRVDLLEEFDARLINYRALALVSIHADSCIYPHATGFKVARVRDSYIPEIEDRLVDCLSRHYGARTGLQFHEHSITRHMTEYHSFYEIDPNTPGAIIETGFMLADRELLTEQPDLVAQGIVDGILCFLEGE